MTYLPTGWAYANLEDLVHVRDAERIPINQKERAKQQGDVPYYGATGRVGWIDKPLFDEDLLLLGEDGVQFFDPNKPKAYLVSGPAWVNNHAHVLECLGVDRRYLKYFLDQADYRGLATGTTRLKLTQAAMKRIPVALAPDGESLRIVDELERRLSHLDAAVNGLTAARRRLAIARRSVLAVLVESEEGSPAWRVKRLDEVAEVRLGRQRSPKNHFGDNMCPYLRAANVTWSGLDLADVKEMHFSEGEVKTYRLDDGDIVMSEASGSAREVGKPAIWRGEVADCCFQNTLIRIRADDGINPEFLLYRLRLEALVGTWAKGFSRGVGIHHLGASRLAAWCLAVPPPSTQRSLVSEVERKLSLLDAAERTIVASRTKAELLRRSLLAAAFSGRLVPQDPDDEPVAELLDRIRSERAAAPAKTTRRTRKASPA